MNATATIPQLESAPATFTGPTLSQLAPATLDIPDPKAQAESEAALRQRLFAPVTTSSRAKRLATALLGPTARVWDRDGKKQVGLQHAEGGQTVFGSADTWADAFVEATKDMAPLQIQRTALGELRSIHSADLRAAFARNRR